MLINHYNHHVTLENVSMNYLRRFWLSKITLVLLLLYADYKIMKIRCFLIVYLDVESIWASNLVRILYIMVKYIKNLNIYSTNYQVLVKINLFFTQGLIFYIKNGQKWPSFIWPSKRAKRERMSSIWRSIALLGSANSLLKTNVSAEPNWAPCSRSWAPKSMEREESHFCTIKLHCNFHDFMLSLE